MDLDGTIIRLKSLLNAVPVYADPNKVNGQSDYISVSSMFLNSNQDISNYTYKLLPNLSTPEYFVSSSRDKEISILAAAIMDMQPVYVYGFGGIGKTEFVMQFARLQSSNRNVFFVPFAGSVRKTIINLKFAGYTMPVLDQMTHEQRQKVEEKIYQDKLLLLNGYSADDIIIIDNFDCDEKTLAELKQEQEYLDLIGLRMHVIFTTRSFCGNRGIEIKPLDESILLNLMNHFLKGQYPDNVLKRIISIVHGHTLTVELCAKLLADEFSGITPKQIIDAFENNHPQELNDAVIESDKDRKFFETTIDNHLRTLFNMTQLTSNEIAVLRHSAFISELGIDYTLFAGIGKTYSEWAKSDIHYVNELRHLCQLGWLKIESRKLFMHPIIRTLVLSFNYESADLDIKLKEYIFNYFSQPVAAILSFAGLELQDVWSKNRDEGLLLFNRQRGEYLVNVSKYFLKDSSFCFARAATCFHDSMDFERSLLYSHMALDLIMKSENKSDSTRMKAENWYALDALEYLWCPNMVESSWDPDFYYGNELEEDHSNESIEVQGVFEKIKHCININR